MSKNELKVKKATLPAESLTRAWLPADFLDVQQCEVVCDCELFPDDLQIGFWTGPPSWVAALYKLRDVLVKFVGLASTEGVSHEAFVNCIRTGQPYRITSVPAKSPEETVLLLSDKHLDAYLAVRVEPAGARSKRVSVITLVHFKRKLGRAYFFLIRPFHGPIVKTMFKSSLSKALG